MWYIEVEQWWLSPHLGNQGWKLGKTCGTHIAELYSSKGKCNQLSAWSEHGQFIRGKVAKNCIFSVEIIFWFITLFSLVKEYVSLSQFTDMLTGRGASKEECIEVRFWEIQ